MKNIKKIAIIGGDARYLPLIHFLNKRDNVHLQLIGFEQVEQSYTGAMQSTIDNLVTNDLDAVLLPITGIDEKGYIAATFSNQKIRLTEEWFSQLPADCLIFTGIANSQLTAYTKNNGLTLIKLMSRNDVAIYNSIPTAEGAIMLAMQHTDITIHGANVFIFGFGRVGETTANRFASLGANVSVVTKYESDLARIYERNWQGYSIDQVSDYIGNSQIIINTIPAKVINQTLLQKMKSEAIVIDLASKPGGTDFSFAEKRGIKAFHALGLPGLVAPKTSGEMLAERIAKILFTSG